MPDRKPPFTFNRVKLTPEYAQELLKLTGKQRSVSEGHVNFIARQIENGDYKFNAESIKIGYNEHGDRVLIDGRHRCLAVIRTGIPIETIIVEGLSIETQLSMDSNRSRTFSDYMRIEGVVDAKETAGLVKFVAELELDLHPPAHTGTRIKLGNAELWRRYIKSPEEFHDGVLRAKKAKRMIGINPSAIGALWMQIKHMDPPEDAEDFYSKLVTGTDMPEGHPALIARRWIHNQRAAPEKNPMFRNHWFQYAVLTKAWNDYRKGRKNVQKYGFRPGGAKPEQFPHPH